MVEIDVITLSDIIDNETPHKRLLEFGKRVWLAEGKECDVIYWDAGNGMCQILQILPKTDDKCIELIMKYLKLILKNIENECDY